MASRALLRQRAAAPAAVAVAAAGLVFYPNREVHAEEPPTSDVREILSRRKPIYDDTPLTHDEPTLTPAPTTPSTPSSPFTPSTPTESYRPTPTDRLATQIGGARMSLYRQALKAEDSINNALTESLRLEHSFTSTIRSLAPPKESNEKLLPGSLYVLVSTMAGSIITRNRNILFRATVPAAIGLGVANYVLPITTHNVGELVWTYEKRFPVVADTHLRIKERVTRFLETGKAHSAMGVGMLEDRLAETREKMEDWVKKGR